MVDVKLEKGNRRFLAASPEAPEARMSDGKSQINALSAVVFMEQ
jgi:hypothetical protein